jgi:uncharacterized protein YcbK (DUF882 family)
MVMPDELFPPLRHFRYWEFLCRCCGIQRMNPQFLTRLDELREAYGRPLRVVSGFRCPAHNTEVSNTGTDGPHTTGRAVDLAVDRGNAYDLVQHAITRRFTGIGLKQHGPKRFIHLDDLQAAPGLLRPTIWTYP